MIRFKRHRTYEEIKALCKKQKVPLNDFNYRERGWDSIMLGTKDDGWVVYNTFNGRFFGKTPTGKDFTSDSTKHDKAEWMQQLLAFFYTNEELPA